MAAKGVLGRVIVLLLLISLLAIAGLLWFDYLGVIEAKSLFAPIYRMIGLEAQSGVASMPSDIADLDDDRLSMRLEALNIQSQELTQKETILLQKEAENLQMAQEIEDRQKSLEEREKTFTETQKQYEDRSVNIEQNAQYLNGMTPGAAVAILIAMDDQDIIDIFRKVDEIATRSGKTSMVSYWMSLMPADRIAEIQRKMATKPLTLP